MVTVIESLVVVPSLQWISPCNMAITTAGPNPRSSETMKIDDQMYANSLVFELLQTTHGGRYTCVAQINVPGVPTVQDVEITDIVVQSKQLSCHSQLL